MAVQIRIGCSGWQYKHWRAGLLRRYKVALCLHDMQGSATGKILVGPFIYVRFHHGTKKYGGRYSDEGLDDWAD